MRRNLRTVPAILIALTLTTAACSSDPDADNADDATTSAPSDEATPTAGDGPTITRSDVDTAIAEWEPRAEAMLIDAGVPGMAVAIVFEDEVVHTEGFGVRELGGGDPIDADTVFQLASLSKPLASTVVAAIVGQGAVGWDDPVVDYDPGFELSDPSVTEQVTFADLFSHRSGLPEHAGDLLEDLGYGREEILERLRFVPLSPVRSEYAYTNFGLTEAGVTAADAVGMSWEEASEEFLYGPAGMTSTSSLYDDYIGQPNRAIPHSILDGEWVAAHQRQPDAQSPAGGASSTATDMANWVRLQLRDGKLDGTELVDAEALAETKAPHAMSSPPREAADPASFYGLGWGTKQDHSGRVVWSHSGAFLLGAATNVNLAPSEDLGIVVLTNGEPVGLAEAVGQTFMDLALDGESPDWLERYGQAFSEMMRPEPEVDYSEPPAGAAPPQALDTYAGTFANDYYGDLVVTERDGSLVMALGPEPLEFPLAPYDSDTFSYEPTGENAVNLSSVTFTLVEGLAVEVTVEHLDEYGLGTFARD